MFSARPDVLHRCYTFSGAGQTHATVASQGHRVGVGGVHVGLAVGQFHGDQPGLVVGTNPLVGLDEGRVQDRLLETQKHREIITFRLEDGSDRFILSTGGFQGSFLVWCASYKTFGKASQTTFND